MKLAIENITLDLDLQPRVELDQAVISEYAEYMKKGDAFPMVTVFHDGATFWLADGWHRVHAAKEAGLLDIEADVRQGSKKDALLFSVAANSKHGLRRTQADKRKAILALVSLPEYANASNREIGRLCRVDDKTVAKYRKGAEFRSEEYIHSDEVVEFFPKGLWLSRECFDSMKGLHDLQDDIKHMIVPEVRKAVHRLKKEGIDKISGPATIYGLGRGKILTLVTNDGYIWWIMTHDIPPDAKDIDDGRAITNTNVLRGFDMAVWWLFQNHGTQFFVSRMKDVFGEQSCSMDERRYWVNPFSPTEECPSCGKCVSWDDLRRSHDNGFVCKACAEVMGCA